MRMRYLTIAALSAAACLGQTKPSVAAPPKPSPAQTMGATIFGSVQTNEAKVEHGKPIGAAWVTLTREQGSARNPTEKILPFSVGHAARADGAFSFTRLEPGTYKLCAQLGKSTMLNPCEWGEPGQVVTLQAEQIVTGLVVTMPYGVAMPIRVDDPQQLLTKHEGKTVGAHLLIGVEDAHGMFHHAPVIGQDSKGRDHQIVVPMDTPVKLVVQSKFFQLADEKGAALAPSGPARPVTAASGQTPTAVKVTVTGVNK